MPTITPHITAQLSVMANRGMSVGQMAAGLGLSPDVVESELRWLRLTTGKAPEREARETTSPSSRVGTVVSS